MKCRIFLCLLVHCTVINSMHNCTRNGDIRIVGLNSTCIIAGRMDLCYNLEWRAVCQHQWDNDDARVVCQQFGFSGASSCTNSCYGRNELQGLYSFQCSGREDKLNDCDPNMNDRCGEAAGVICFETNGCIFQPPVTISTSEVLTTTTASTTHSITTPCACEDTESVHDTSDSDGDTSTACPMVTTGSAGAVGENSTAIGAALGGVAALLLLILMGVVMGWVWTCCRKTHKSQIQRDCDTDFNNFTYTQTSSSSGLCPSVYYSSMGPRDMPRDNTTHPLGQTGRQAERQAKMKGGGERVHHVLEKESEKGGEYADYQEIEGEGEAVYHALEEVGEGQGEGYDRGLTYEVPIQSKTTGLNNDGANGKTKTAGMDVYSKLQYK